MRSFIAALRNLVLPFGQTSGKRIVLDGDNGQIVLYDASNNIAGALTINGPQQFGQPTVNEGFYTEQNSPLYPAPAKAWAALYPGGLYFGDTGASTSQWDWPINYGYSEVAGFLAAQIGSGAINAGDLPTILQVIATASGADPGFRVDSPMVPAQNGGVDFDLNGISMGRGNRGFFTGQTGTITATEAQILQTSPNITLWPGRCYRVDVELEVTCPGTTGTPCEVYCRAFSDNAGVFTLLRTMGVVTQIGQNATFYTGHSEFYFHMSQSSEILRGISIAMHNSMTTASITMSGNSYITVEDVGSVANFPGAPNIT